MIRNFIYKALHINIALKDNISLQDILSRNQQLSRVYPAYMHFLGSLSVAT